MIPEELINQLNKKIVVVSFIVTIAWFVLGYFNPGVFFFTWLPLTVLAVFSINEKTPEKYLIPAAFSLAIFYDFAESLIIKRNFSAWESFFGIMDFVCTIFIFFFLFSIQIFIQSNPNQKYEEEKEIIIKKLLWLILVAIVTFIIFFSYVKYFL